MSEQSTTSLQDAIPNPDSEGKNINSTEDTQETSGAESSVSDQSNEETTLVTSPKSAHEDSTLEGAPEQYEFKASEGFTLDEAVIGAYSEVAKELNLPQAQAQKVIDKVAPIMLSRQEELLGQARKDWEQASTTDQEFGGVKLQENLATAKKAIESYGSPELIKVLNESGLGNHPEFIRFFYRAGKGLMQDTIINERAAAGEGQSIEDKLYPNMK